MKTSNCVWKGLFERLKNRVEGLLFFAIQKPLQVLALVLIRLYQLIVSPLLGSHCRFQPSCSAYARQAFQEFSFLTALRLSVFRVLKCHPLGKYGYDPLPQFRKEKKHA